MRLPSLLLRLALPLLAALPAAAETSGLRLLATGDDTRGWAAVGRLQIGVETFCTGAMIAPDLVLTAAHCLYSRRTGAMVEPSEIRFLAGWRNGRAEAYRGARRAAVHPAYRFDGQDRLGRIASDLALVRLDQPIRLPQVQPFALDLDPVPGTSVGVVSYALERAEAPSIQEMCEVIGREGMVMVMSCTVDFGSSGAPVFAMRGGRPEIVSVVSAKADLGGRPVSLGTSVRALEEVRAALEAAPGSYAAQGAQVTSGAGAKFLKP